MHTGVPSRRNAAAVLGIGVLLWVTPVLAALALGAPDSILVTRAWFSAGPH
jgi:hypothetical protein